MASSQVQARGRGRPRDESARQRILKAALELMDTTAFTQITVEGIAARAGTSKATVYRWWPNKAAVAIEAFREAVAPELPLRNAGTLRDDLSNQLRNFSRLLSGPGGRMLRSFVVAGMSDPAVASAFRSTWSAPRRAEAKRMLRQKQVSGQLREDADLDLVLDLLYAPLYYRFLLKNEPPSQKYVEAVLALLIPALEALRARSS